MLILREHTLFLALKLQFKNTRWFTLLHWVGAVAACLVYCVSRILFRMSLAMDVRCVLCSVQFSFIGTCILACLNSAWMMFRSQHLNCLLWPKTSCFLQSLASVRSITFQLATVIRTWSLYWFTSQWHSGTRLIHFVKNSANYVY